MATGAVHMACPILVLGEIQGHNTRAALSKCHSRMDDRWEKTQSLEGTTVQSVASASHGGNACLGIGAHWVPAYSQNSWGKPSWQVTSCRCEAWRCLVDTEVWLAWQLLNDFWKQQFPRQDTISRQTVWATCGCWRTMAAEKGPTAPSVPSH